MKEEGRGERGGGGGGGGGGVEARAGGKGGAVESGWGVGRCVGEQGLGGGVVPI